MQSRYYNPEWGRFLNADAIAGSVGELLGANIFAYCKNTPVNGLDSTGYMYDDNSCGGLEDMAFAKMQGNDFFSDDNVIEKIAIDESLEDCESDLEMRDEQIESQQELRNEEKESERENLKNNFKKSDPKQIEKKYNLKKGQFHREVKRDIVKYLSKVTSPYKNMMNKMGDNPDIYLSADGQIEIVSTKYSGKSFITDLTIQLFLP